MTGSLVRELGARDCACGGKPRNGKDDLVYRGNCGPPGAPCCTSSTFVYQSAWDQGAGVLRDGPEITEHFEQVGDMNDEGKADIGYLGRCGTDNQAMALPPHEARRQRFEIECSDSYLFE